MKSTLLSIALALLTSVAQAAAPPTELKDAAGKTIIQYVVEPPDTVAPASTTDPARQLGLITILDNKRNDIASTAEAYADAALDGVRFGDTRLPV